MESNTRLEAVDERDWVYNGTDFPSVVFLAHYYRYSLISARDVLSKHREWVNNESDEFTEAILNELRQTIPDLNLITPVDNELAVAEYKVAKEVSTAIGENGGEVGGGCDREWNPFRKDVVDEFDVMHFLSGCGVSDDYLKQDITIVISTLKQFIEPFNEWLDCDGETLNVNSTFEEIISTVSEMTDDVQYKETITNYLGALSILYKQSDRVFYTNSGIYTSRGILARFMFAYKQETKSAVGAFQVLYQS